MLIALPMSASKSQFFINQAYVEYLQEAQLTPILIPQNAKDLDVFVNTADGLLLPGGIDVDPIFYGECNYNSRGTELEKDTFERTLLHKFIQAKKPIFGICRGFQLIARELFLEFPTLESKKGFSYKQHINNHNGPDMLNINRDTPYHDIMSNRHKLWGEGQPNIFNQKFINSMHHQAVTINKNTLLKATATKQYTINSKIDPIEILAYTDYGLQEKDATLIVEAFQADWKGTKIRAVQWHPEELKDYALLNMFFSNTEAMEAT